MHTLIPESLTSFLESGLSTLVGTTSTERRPHCMRAIGVTVHDAGHSARVYLPCAGAKRTVENLLATRKIAVTLSKPPTHRTLQLKGCLEHICQTPEHERTEVERLFATFLEDLVFIGVPRGIIARTNRWPCWSVDFSVDGLFEQTPGPRAGQVLEEGVR